MNSGRVLGLSLLLAAGACTAPGGADTGPVCQLDTGGGHPTWANFGHAFFLGYCDSCHAASSPNRFGAPETTTFDSEAEVAAQSSRIRTRVIDEETMPLGGGLPPEDLAELDNYLSCLQLPGSSWP